LHYFVLTLPALILVLSMLTGEMTLSRGASRTCVTLVAWLGLSINPLAALGIAFTNATYGTLVVGATIALLVATTAASGPHMVAGPDTPHPRSTH
jgi:hypothetical protein